MSKPVILTGIRANNDLHIGNYFGALLPMIDMARSRSDEFQINMFIPDLHSFTTPIDHSILYDSILQNARVYAAAGLPLDNGSINLYRQSFVPAHSEMTWILDCFTRIGVLGRMTQFKDKSEQQRKKEIDESPLLQTLLALDNKGSALKPEYLSRSPAQELRQLESILRDVDKSAIADKIDEIRIKVDEERTRHLTQILDLYKVLNEETIGRGLSSVGLFNYPVLMAADILLYGSKYVPVGDDQTQHLEFARDIAQRMNAKFGELFVVPEPVAKQHEFFGKDQGLRIKDLLDPAKKMSKSDETGKGVIFLNDTPEEAAKKVMGATTDDRASVNYDRENQPGISNLLEILALLRGTSLDSVITEFKGQSRYGDFKKVVADEVAKFLYEFQNNLASVDDQVLLAKLESSEENMNQQAKETLLRVQKAIGLRR